MRVQYPSVSRPDSERGIALVTTIMILILMSALMIGFTAAVTSDQRYRRIDQERMRAFYAAQSGIEKLNAELADLFFVYLSPSDEQIAALAETPPTVPDVAFVDEGDPAYGVWPTGSSTGQISSGPYQGLIALKETYDLDATARTTGGGEVHLRRSVETVAIPVFQFGMFSEVDLSFHAGPNFNFGGRIHTNANLFLAHGKNKTLTLPEKVTAVGEIIRKRLVNDNLISNSNHQGTIRTAKAPGSYRNLLATEGSVTDGIGSPENVSWPTISLSAYNGYIRDGTTGAKALKLPLTQSQVGGVSTDLVRRPPVDEDSSNPTLFGERYFSQVSLRILLSDTAADITSLPSVVTGTPPVELAGNWITAAPDNGTPYGPVDATHPPIARSEGSVTASVNLAVGAGNAKKIRVTAMPAYFQIPATLTLTEGASTYTVTCTKKTATRFRGCGATTPVIASIASGSTVSATVPTADGSVVVQTTLTAMYNTAAGRFDVTSTLAFAPNQFWVQGTNGLVTCSGYDTTPRFTGCSVSTAIANGAILTTSARSDQGTGTIGGFIKIEMQDASRTWNDVTMEILNYGIAGANLSGKACGDPTPNAIIRLQRLRDNNEVNTWPPSGGACSYAASQRSTDYWPNTLFDLREALQRDQNPGSTVIILGGVMHYVTLDVANLSRWFTGTGAFAAGSGTGALSNNGFAVYFSDRRNNRDSTNQETGEYGFEDIINPGSATGAPRQRAQYGDVNANAILESYGQIPSYNGVSNSAPPGAAAPLTTAARPNTTLSAGEAKVNRAILFRRALKLINGGISGGVNSIVAPGLTIAAENPVYISGRLERLQRECDRGTQRCHVDRRRRSDAAVERLERQQLVQLALCNRRPCPQRELVLPLCGHCRQERAFRSACGREPATGLRYRRRGAQLPPHARAGRHGELPRIDRDLLLQPAGGRRLQVLRYGVRRSHEGLQL